MGMRREPDAATEATLFIGRPMARPNSRRLVQGRGTYVDDISLPRMVHLAFLRSPYAHADILEIDVEAARKSPGVVAIMTGKDLALHHTAWRGILTHQPGLRSAPQHALAVDCARWQGEPVVAVAAQTRAEAEDAVELINVSWKQLPAVADAGLALQPGAQPIHPELDSNLAYS
jgi:carbon-monoxide dehydrogenase large subunit